MQRVSISRGQGLPWAAKGGDGRTWSQAAKGGNKDEQKIVAVLEKIQGPMEDGTLVRRIDLDASEKELIAQLSR